MAVTPATEPWTALLEQGRSDGRLVREAFEGARPPVLADVPEGLHPLLRDALARVGVEALYEHQHEALHSALEQTTIVTTSTASGKSLCFHLPTLHALLSRPTARALYLYPTKALAQDQVRALAAFGLGTRLRPAIYDGDTPTEARRDIRKTANLLLTNPDMLHMGILPNHARLWGDFFANLDVVVVDEAHVYRGVFGAHVANVLRRLRRICPREPRFVLTSATIANPGELAERLTGLDDVRVVDRDGSPGARRQIAMWNPPVVDEITQARASALGEAADLLCELVTSDPPARTICFIKSRKAVELVAKLVADRLADEAPDLADRVAPYRAGYTPAQRREIEARLTSGELLAVITTDALELGIDIGALDACVVVTFPGTVASLRQMWGRAGRRGRGLAVYIAGDDALDQFFCRHPDEFLDRPVEAAIVDHENEHIHLPHLLCAAHEAPLDEHDAETLGPRWRGHAEALEARGELVQRRGRFVLRHAEEFPAAGISLRSAATDVFSVIDVTAGELLGTVEGARAHATVHEGAAYLHLGRSYEVVELDLDERRALVRPFEGGWYTQPKRETDTFVERLLDRRDAIGVVLSFGTVTVTDHVLAYQRKRLPGHEVVELRALELPPTTFTTQALWYELSDDVLGALSATDPSNGAQSAGGGGAHVHALPTTPLLGALHAAEHAQIAVLPLLAMCDRWDIGGLSTNLHPQTGGPTIFIYDGHPGGVGITRQGFRAFERLVADAHRLVADCPCASGCPSCVQSPKCGNLNEPLAKRGAQDVMAAMLARR